MENIKIYIETGALEQYVLGDLSPEEMLQVETMAALHEEVRKELDAIEQSLEKFAIQNAVQPPVDLEKKLFQKLGLKQDFTVEADEIKTHAEPIIVPLKPNNANIRTLRFALVACVALLVISVAALFVAYNKLNDAHQQIASLNLNNQKFAATVSQLEFKNGGLSQAVAMSSSKEWATVRLAGVKNTPSANMDVYWNKQNKEVLINYTAMSLPTTDQAHQYQLWALVNGKPVSLGVFGGKNLPLEATLKMEGIDTAQAFAVTIEPMGGSSSPTMEKMVVMGSV
ncbi:anti-sigma factor [Pedobacter sp. UYP30]|uniref:anti-sigma factor n=1 Tax=Pedobacter sp. UYP30 TaxID=1756400 RepID=UPI00339544A2